VEDIVGLTPPVIGEIGLTPFVWTADHLAIAERCRPAAAPMLTPAGIKRVTEAMDIWDHWPVLEVDGRVAEIDGRTLVFALSAPVCDDPNRRHDLARLRLFSVVGDDWTDLGPVFAVEFTPGSREWAGSAVVDAAHTRLDLYFTATGQAREDTPTFRQRIMQSYARMVRIEGLLRAVDWQRPVELIRPDGVMYETRHEGGAVVGTIKAFRDPFVFVSGTDATEWMVFTASSAESDNPWNGVVGLAERQDSGWVTHAPLVTAIGVNNELERPHVVEHGGRLYLFWSTQADVFAPQLEGRTGLYGLVADRLEGPWAPLNGSGLVFANPDAAPAQAYSWQVLDTLEVWGFADRIALAGRATEPAPFAGTAAPRLRLWLDDDRAGLEL
jgi:levansucrase